MPGTGGQGPEELSHPVPSAKTRSGQTPRPLPLSRGRGRCESFHFHLNGRKRGPSADGSRVRKTRRHPHFHTRYVKCFIAGDREAFPLRALLLGHTRVRTLRVLHRDCADGAHGRHLPGGMAHCAGNASRARSRLPASRRSSSVFMRCSKSTSERGTLCVSRLLNRASVVSKGTGSESLEAPVQRQDPRGRHLYFHSHKLKGSLHLSLPTKDSLVPP